MVHLQYKIQKYIDNKSKITFRLINHQEYFVTGIINKIFDLSDPLQHDHYTYLFLIEVETDKGKMYFYDNEIDSETITLANYNPIRYFIRESISQELKDFIFKRDNNLCQLKLNGCSNKSECIDHIIPISKGGLSIPENLQASCNHCNQLKSSNIYF